ncbi:MAG: hypothetical protein APF81_26425 [Desulfosporosinus sp. BRH_c37]|nr:MAG: hypothetical protein APF81_26425 [Desulfosporosinus sp. BRH_c37]
MEESHFWNLIRNIVVFVLVALPLNYPENIYSVSLITIYQSIHFLIYHMYQSNRSIYLHILIPFIFAIGTSFAVGVNHLTMRLMLFGFNKFDFQMNEGLIFDLLLGSITINFLLILLVLNLKQFGLLKK